jgi:hypothetical protein
MKFPIIIQKHESGYVIDIPEIGDGKPFDFEKIAAGFVDGKHGKEIPERWKRPCKLYSGFIYGIHPVIAGQADTVEELREILKQKVLFRNG